MTNSRTPIIGIITLLFCFVLSVRADMVHRYSFDGNTNDSIGGQDGVLVNQTGDVSFEDGILTLGNDGSQSSNSGEGDYVDLPNGMISAVGDVATYECWVFWDGPSNSSWQEIYSFGTSDDGEDSSRNGSNSTYLMTTPQSGDGTLRAGYKYGETGHEEKLDRDEIAPLGGLVHLVFSWDKPNGIASFYVDGQLIESGTTHFSIVDDLIDNNNWLGRSQWDDPLFVGRYEEFRIYDHAMTEADAVASFNAGAERSPVNQPSPADGGVGVKGPVVPNWQPGQALPDALEGYDIYVGTDKELVEVADTTDSSGIFRGSFGPIATSYALTGLEGNQTYYWRIDERVAGGIRIRGAVWQFKTYQTWVMKEAPLMTPWAEDVDPANVLPEYPRPQMVRDAWMNLNGLWDYKPGTSEDQVDALGEFAGEILVPFPVESALSGVMERMNRLWYRRTFELPAGWAGQRILLHFEMVDWEAEAFVNGQSVGVHQGGFDPFVFDITDALVAEGPQELIVRVYDPMDAENTVRGKQNNVSEGIWYTSVTGIWDTVWLEPVNTTYLGDVTLIPDVDLSRLNVTAMIDGDQGVGYTVDATARIGDLVVGQVSGNPGDELYLQLQNPRLWAPGDPFLYDLDIVLKRGQDEVDRLTSYFGMRKVELIENNGYQWMAVNGEFQFQIGPLDQGFWPDGIYRAPTDEALKWDLEQIQAYGFNMLRKHTKVEPRRLYYWADKMGLLVWQDMPSMRSVPAEGSVQRERFERELEELVHDHINSPSIIMWVVFNEGWGQHETVRLTEKTMAMDPSRLVSCTSGWTDYPVGHIRDRHSYPAPGAPDPDPTRAMVCGEYGGIGYAIEGHLWTPDSWGYTSVDSPEAYAALYGSFYGSLIDMMATNGLNAGVYTQITDVELEINGLITYDRKVFKVAPEVIKEIHQEVYASSREIVPTSEDAGIDWSYTFDVPSVSWYTVEYDDSGWAVGPGGFGTSFTPGSVVGTEWNTDDIWIRRTFIAPDVEPHELDKLYFRVHHDEDVEIYLNGVLAASALGYTSDYTRLAMTAEGRAAYRPGEENVLAVHCHQTRGGQFIDVGIWTRDCICPPGECVDLNGDSITSIEDLQLMAQSWLMGYNLYDVSRLSEYWYLCR